MDNASLKTLHTALIDAGNGYREAVKDAEQPELKGLFQQMIDLHQRSHAAVHDVLLRRGESPDDGGSFMSTVHETVIAVRSAVTGLDRGALSSFASGEEHTVKAYAEAIRENADDTAVAETLTRHKSLLESKVAQMKGMSA